MYSSKQRLRQWFGVRRLNSQFLKKPWEMVEGRVHLELFVRVPLELFVLVR